MENDFKIVDAPPTYNFKKMLDGHGNIIANYWPGVICFNRRMSSCNVSFLKDVIKAVDAYEAKDK